MKQPDLHGHIVVVTGAARGIGAAVAAEAANLGSKVVLVSKTKAALEELDDQIQAAGNQPTVLAPLDLTERAHVDALGGMLFKRFGRIDLLVHAAGDPGKLTPVAHMDALELQQNLVAEIIATQHLIRSFETLLRISKGGRAIFLTCEAATTASAYFGMAGAAKAGVEVLVRTWHAELRQTAVQVALIDPGRVLGTRTETRRYPGGSKEHLPNAAEAASRILATLVDPVDPNGSVVRLQSPPRCS